MGLETPGGLPSIVELSLKPLLPYFLQMNHRIWSLPLPHPPNLPPFKRALNLSSLQKLALLMAPPTSYLVRAVIYLQTGP